MTLQNITISTINNTDLYFLKADGSDFIQAPISETTHIGVLRYAPTEAGLYQGEVYTNASALKQYTKFPVSLTVLNVLTVDVFVSITDPSDDPDYAGWFQVGKDLPVIGTSFGLLESDVSVGTNIWVMVRDSVNAGVYDIHTAHVYSTITLLTYPDHAEIDETFTVSGKANCSQVKITFTSTSGEVSYVVSVVNGVYSKADCALSTVDGFVPFDDVSIKVEDNNDALSFVTVVDALVIVLSDLDFLVISAGEYHSLGIWDGKVYAWGYNNKGQLGDGSTTQRYKPVAVAVDTSLAGKTVVSVSAGQYSSFALCDDGTVHAWGNNNSGQLGDGSTTQRYKPVAVAVDTSLAGKKVISVSAGQYSSFALCDDGTVHAWGSNTYGQLGDGSTTQRNKPVAVAVDTSLAGKTVVGISGGHYFSLAVCSDGTAHAWGYNNYGQLGDGSTTQREKPVAVAVDTSLAGKTVVGISAGDSFSLAVCSDGTAHAWGYNAQGQLGDESTTQREKPVAVAVDTSLAGKTVVGISGGNYFSLAVCSDGTAHAWGYNGSGELGDGSTTQRNKPVAVAVDTSLAGKTVVGISGGHYFSLAVCSDGTAHAWGDNSKGQLGDNSTTQRTKPVLVDTSGI